MYWIPICAVVGIICLIRYVINAIGNTKSTIEWNNVKSIQEEFRNQVIDEELERQISKNYSGDIAKSCDVVCNFAKFRPETDGYPPVVLKCKTWATATSMVNYGKLPRDMVFGDLNTRTRYQSERELIERYLLKLESKLNDRGIKTFILYGKNVGSPLSPYPYEYYKLSEYVDKYGYGLTNASDKLEFVNLSTHNKDYPEIYN